ncbi:AAA family ATPase [Kaarinaea lacus]
MYESFYNLHPTPFRLTPDPHFFFESDTHKRGLAYLRFAFYQEEGFVVITGAPGTGKTELMLNLISELPRHKVTLAKIVTSNLDADDLLDLVAASFLIDPEHLSKGSLLKRLEDYFIHQAYNGKHVLLLIDEAQNLSIKSLVELSMLSNFQINEKPVMQCFLLGQDSLEEKLNIPKLVHLKQRVLASTRLENLSQQETREYITHRLVKSGWDNNPIIRDAAFALIHYYTKGIPRKINSLCNRVLLQSYLDDRHDIGADLVHQVIEELQGELLAKEPEINLALAEAQLSLEEILKEEYKGNLIAQIDSDSSSSTNDGIDLKPTSNVDKNLSQPLSDANSNVITIPEFIKKKENTSTQNTEDRTKPTIRSDNLESNVAPKELKETQPQEVTPHSIVISKDDSKKITDEAQKDKHPDNPESKNNLPHTQPYQTRPQEHLKKRQSGLVDKELQALASLCDTSSSNQRSSKSANISGESQSPSSTFSKKIIIDDLAYEQVDHDESSTTPGFVEKTAAKLERHYNWQPAAVMIALMVSIGLSIYWFSDGKTERINLTNKGQPTEVVAKNVSGKSVIDLLVPEIKTTLIEAKPESEIILKHTAIPELDTPPIDSDPVPSDIDQASDKTLVASNSVNTDISDTTDTVQSITTQLDREITAILEKPTLETQAVTETLAPATATPELAKTSISADSLVASPAQVTAKNSGPVENKPAQHKKPAKQRQTTKPEHLASSAAASTNRTDSKADNNSERTPILGTPIALQEEVTPVTPGALSAKDTAVTGASQHAVHPEHLDAVTQDTTLISGSDLKTLLSTLATAYENGNLQKLISTFADDIYSSDGAGRKQIENDYRHLFNITDNRQLTIHDITWSQQDKQMLGKGDFKVRIREKGANRYTTYAGKISLAVVKESNNIVIRKLDYDYNN